eukprot:m.3447 g.3447  ORF g.3447 m.3447 type:complete len:65 (-) comp3485_c0_seq1:127-321(-)
MWFYVYVYDVVQTCHLGTILCESNTLCGLNVTNTNPPLRLMLTTSTLEGGHLGVAGASFIVPLP